MLRPSLRKLLFALATAASVQTLLFACKTVEGRSTVAAAPESDSSAIFRTILNKYGGGGTTGLRQEQKRFLTSGDAVTFMNWSFNQFAKNPVVGESWALRDVPPPGRVLGTVTDYLPKGKDNWVMRIRGYTTRSDQGGSHTPSDANVSKLEAKIPVQSIDGVAIDGVVRKPSVSFFNTDLAAMFASRASLASAKDAIVARTVELNRGRVDPEIISALIAKIDNLMVEKAEPMPIDLNIQYERQAYAATFVDHTNGEPIEAQVTKDNNVRYTKPAPIDADHPYQGPYHSMVSGTPAGEVPADITIVEFKLPVKYALLGIQKPAAFDLINPALRTFMQQYKQLQNVSGVNLDKGKSSFFRNSGAADERTIDSPVKDPVGRDTDLNAGQDVFTDSGRDSLDSSAGRSNSDDGKAAPDGTAGRTGGGK